MSADNWAICPKCQQVAYAKRDALREDWDIGIDRGGAFKVRYEASCHVCKFHFAHNYKEVAYEPE